MAGMEPVFSPFQVQSVSFGVYSEEQIRRLSVLQVSNPTSFNSLMHPTHNGAYAPALGPLEQTERCETCFQLGAHCPGHMGHIELPLPVYHPMFFGSASQQINRRRKEKEERKSKSIKR
mgnify:CR=1 FL=1